MKILEKISFCRPKREIVSIEIGMDWLKVAQAIVGPAGRKITKLNIKRIVSLKESFSKGIADALREADIKSNTVFTYLPRHLTTIRILELPSMDKNEIADMVELQAAEQTPYSKEEIIANFKILGPGKKKGYTKVMLVIVRKSVIEERIKLFREANLEVRFIGLSSEMTLRLYQHIQKYKQMADKDTTIGFIDMDSNFTDFLFICNNNLIFTRSIFIGTENILTEPEAWRDKFVNQIRNSLEIFKQQGLGKDVSKIIMNEISAKTTGLMGLLSKTLNLPIELLNPLESSPLSEESLNAAISYSKNVSLLACLGSLLSSGEPELDLMPQQIQMKRRLEKRSKEVVFSGMLLLSGLMIISGIFAERIYNKSGFLNMLKQRISETDKEAGNIERMRVKIDMIREYSDKKASFLNCLRELYRVIPDEIYLSSLIYSDGKQVALTGTSGSMSTVFKFVNVLENLEYFEKIKTNYATKKRGENEEVVDFELVCPIAR